MPYYVANPKVSCSVEQLLCLEILLLPAKYKESRILSTSNITTMNNYCYWDLRIECKRLWIIYLYNDSTTTTYNIALESILPINASRSLTGKFLFQRSLKFCPSGFIIFCQQKSCAPIRIFFIQTSHRGWSTAKNVCKIL